MKATIQVNRIPTGTRRASLIALLLLPATLLAGYENAVRDALKDPESARFYDIKTFPNRNVCGYVNAKNSYGGYVGKKPFAYVFGRVILDLGSYEISCELASDPPKFAARTAELKSEEAKRKQAALDAAAALQRRQRAKEATEQSRIEQLSYEACAGQRQELLEDAKHNIEQLHSEIAPTSLKGSVDLHNQSTLDISSCPARFLRELSPIVNEERKLLFQTYCVDRRIQRQRESMFDRSADRLISKACGNDYVRGLIPADFTGFSIRVQKEQRANPREWECRILRDYAIVGDKLSKVYYAKEFQEKCAAVKDQLD